MTGRTWLAIAAVLALMAGSAWAAWEWQANDYQGQLAEQARLHQQDLATISSAAATQSRQALEKQQAAEQALHDLDTISTKEKTDALYENDRLRDAVADGNRRLRVAGSCRSGSGDVPGTDSASGLGDAGAPRLTKQAERDYFDLRGGIVTVTSQLKACQAYINTVLNK